MSVTAYHFWSPTCGPCKTIKPAIHELIEEFPNVGWVSVNTQDDPSTFAIKYNIRVVPTVVVVVSDIHGNQVLVESHSGTGISGYYRILRNGLRKLSLT
jgi:thiol-disulfide isomerase/thioredoxin